MAQFDLENQKIIDDFIEEKRLQPVGEARQKKLKSVLNNLSSKATKPFNTMEAPDTKQMMGQIIGKGYADETEADYQKICISFFRYIHGCDSNVRPDCVKWIKVIKPKGKVKKSDCFSPEEKAALIHAADDYQKKAFVSAPLDCGLRDCEAKRLRIGDLLPDDRGYRLSVLGKNGIPRIVRAVDSVEALKDWLLHHPQANDPEAYYFVAKSKDGYKQLSDSMIGKRFRDICEKAGIPRHKQKFYLMRHTRIGEYKRYMNDEDLKKYFGWSRESDMPSRYAQLEDSDVDDKVLSIHGMGKPNNQLNPAEKIKTLDIDATLTKLMQLLEAYPDLTTRLGVALIMTDPHRQTGPTYTAGMTVKEWESQVLSEAPDGLRIKRVVPSFKKQRGEPK